MPQTLLPLGWNRIVDHPSRADSYDQALPAARPPMGQPSVPGCVGSQRLLVAVRGPGVDEGGPAK